MDNSPFGRLPPEIRVLIWDLVLYQPNGVPMSLITAAGDNIGHFKAAETLRIQHPLALSRLCRTTREETRQIFYKLNTFRFPILLDSLNYNDFEIRPGGGPNFLRPFDNDTYSLKPSPGAIDHPFSNTNALRTRIHNVFRGAHGAAIAGLEWDIGTWYYPSAREDKVLKRPPFNEGDIVHSLAHALLQASAEVQRLTSVVTGSAAVPVACSMAVRGGLRTYMLTKDRVAAEVEEIRLRLPLPSLQISVAAIEELMTPHHERVRMEADNSVRFRKYAALREVRRRVEKLMEKLDEMKKAEERLAKQLGELAVQASNNDGDH